MNALGLIAEESELLIGGVGTMEVEATAARGGEMVIYRGASGTTLTTMGTAGAMAGGSIVTQQQHLPLTTTHEIATAVLQNGIEKAVNYSLDRVKQWGENRIRRANERLRHRLSPSTRAKARTEAKSGDFSTPEKVRPSATRRERIPNGWTPPTYKRAINRRTPYWYGYGARGKIGWTPPKWMYRAQNVMGKKQRRYY